MLKNATNGNTGLDFAGALVPLVPGAGEQQQEDSAGVSPGAGAQAEDGEPGQGEDQRPGQAQGEVAP